MAIPVNARVLIVEDEVVIALMLQDMVRDLGLVIGGVAPGIAEALALIAGPQRFDVATLNINLQGQTSEAVALALDARGIPFVVITGYDQQYLSPAFQGQPILQKPFQLKQLAESLGALGRP